MQIRRSHRLLLFETGHSAEVKADVEQRLSYVCACLVFLLLKKISFLHAFLCVEEFLNFKKKNPCLQEEIWILYLLTSNRFYLNLYIVALLI